MQYLYSPSDDFSDLASGAVLHGGGGFTNFPVRLAREVFLRAARHVDTRPLSVWDPCCGCGYLLAVLGLLCPGMIARIYASDVDERALDTARRNLALLSRGGMRRRVEELRGRSAFDAAERLLAGMGDAGPEARVFRRDILRPEPADFQALNPSFDVGADIVITDVPYGGLAQWSGLEDPGEDALTALLRNIAPALRTGSAVAGCSDRRQKIHTETLAALGYVRAEREQVGKRRFEIVRWVG